MTEGGSGRQITEGDTFLSTGVDRKQPEARRRRGANLRDGNWMNHSVNGFSRCLFLLFVSFFFPTFFGGPGPVILGVGALLFFFFFFCCRNGPRRGICTPDVMAMQLL